MADTKISALTSASTPLAGTEVLPIVQSSTTVKVATNDLTVRNVRANTTTGILQITGPTAATTRVATVPDANFTVARTDATQTFTGTQRFTGAIMGGSSNVNYEILGTSAYSAVLVGAGVARASKISPTDDSGYVGWLFSSQTDTFSTSTQLPSDGATFADRFKVDGLNGDGTLYTGNLVIGTSGKGIDFSATAGTGTSELLADYEEGTWTPNQGGGLTVVGAFSSSGTYTKVGRQVTVSGVVTGATSINTSGSGIVCTNLPFAIATSVPVGVMTNTATNNSNVYGNPTTSTMYSSTATGVSGSLYFTLTYITS